MDSDIEKYKHILDIEGLGRKGKKMAKEFNMSYSGYKSSTSLNKKPTRWVSAFVWGYELAKGMKDGE